MIRASPTTLTATRFTLLGNRASAGDGEIIRTRGNEAHL